MTVDLMATLAKLYEKPSASNKVFLMKRLFNLKMSEGGSVAEHLNEFNTITSQLSSVKITFAEEVRALLILCSLLESWNSLVMAVSNSVSGKNTLVFDDIVGVILSEEMRRKSTGETPTSSNSLLNVENKGRSKCKAKNRDRTLVVLPSSNSEEREGRFARIRWFSLRGETLHSKEGLKLTRSNPTQCKIGF